MEFRHDDDIRYHVEDVIRGFPLSTNRTALLDTRPAAAEEDEEERQAVEVEGVEDAEEGRTLVGYPVVFNNWTEIQSWDGPFMERIDPAAADKTLASRADKIQLMFNHGFDFMLEQTPIGRHQKFEPDDSGVWNEAALVNRDVYEKLDLVVELIRMGAIYGQSFRFQVMAEEWVDEPDPSDHNPKGYPERSITEFRWYESGPVTYPAYEATSVGLRDGEPFAVRTRDEWKDWVEGRNVPTIVEIVEQARARRSPGLLAARTKTKLSHYRRELEALTE